jgi:hypothetical protein
VHDGLAVLQRDVQLAGLQPMSGGDGVRTPAERGHGERVARAFQGAWRASPPLLDLSGPELDSITPLLLASGGGALGFWRIRHSAVTGSLALPKLRQAYRLHALEAVLHEREIGRAVVLLRSAGIEPLLVKGWAAARLYAEPGLRPYGDVDLVVPRGRLRLAQATIESERFDWPLDLHERYDELADRDVSQVFERAETVPIADTVVRIPGAEDHLRILCLHLLRHGAWRPLWLCDVGATLESCDARFDWDRVFDGGRRRSEWVASVLNLAQRLLGAKLERSAIPARPGALPGWLVSAVLEEWGRDARHRRTPLVEAVARRPAAILAELGRRWPNPVRASFERAGRPNEWPRFPFQFGEYLVGAFSIPRQVGEWLTRRRRRARRAPAPRVSGAL